jgi:hypothetical protein
MHTLPFVSNWPFMFYGQDSSAASEQKKVPLSDSSDEE